MKTYKIVDVDGLSAAWKAKGLTIASEHPGSIGDLIKDLFDACSKDLQNWSHENKPDSEN